MDWELHLNPIGLAVGLGVTAVAASTAAFLMGVGARPLTAEDIARIRAEIDLFLEEARLAEEEAAGFPACDQACLSLPTADLILECRNRCAAERDAALERARVAREKAKQLEDALSIPFSLVERPRFLPFTDPLNVPGIEGKGPDFPIWPFLGLGGLIWKFLSRPPPK